MCLKSISWVVVSNPGGDDEREEAEFREYKKAIEFSESSEEPCDVMRRSVDGELTTEF